MEAFVFIILHIFFANVRSFENWAVLAGEYLVCLDQLGVSKKIWQIIKPHVK